MPRPKLSIVSFLSKSSWHVLNSKWFQFRIDDRAQLLRIARNFDQDLHSFVYSAKILKRTDLLTCASASWRLYANIFCEHWCRYHSWCWIRSLGGSYASILCAHLVRALCAPLLPHWLCWSGIVVEVIVELIECRFRLSFSVFLWLTLFIAFCVRWCDQISVFQDRSFSAGLSPRTASRILM